MNLYGISNGISWIWDGYVNNIYFLTYKWRVDLIPRIWEVYPQLYGKGVLMKVPFLVCSWLDDLSRILSIFISRMMKLDLAGNHMTSKWKSRDRHWTSRDVISKFILRRWFKWWTPFLKSDYNGINLNFVPINWSCSPTTCSPLSERSIVEICFKSVESGISRSNLHLWIDQRHY